MPTAHESLVEKVALGLANAERGNNAAFHLEWINHGPSDDVYRFRARAAIATIYAAMREPSEEMIDAGESHDRQAAEYSGYSIEYAGCEEHYRAMLDASPLNPEAKP